MDDSRSFPAWSDGKAFEDFATRYLTDLWNVDLACRPVALTGGVSKKFDLVSPDGRIVGDAKFYKNIQTPAAKWSTIAEYVWLLQHIPDAERRFMVFGLDREVPARWLVRFRALCEGVDFYFLGADGLEVL